MKSFYLSSFLLLCLCKPAAAQLLDQLQLDTQLDGVARELESITGEVQEQVHKAASEDLLTQHKLDDALARPVEGVLDKLVDVLPILARDGTIAFVEVKVEQDWRAVEREWLIMLEPSALSDLSALDAEIIEQTRFEGLDMQLVRFRVPARLDSLTELKKHLPAHLYDHLDRNHIYIPQAQTDIPLSSPAAPVISGGCNDVVSIGIVDTAINIRHPAFIKSRIETNDFAGEGFDAPRAHGTAVAGLLVGQGAQLAPLLPDATLYAASVFYPRNEYAQGATMMNVVRALNWLAAKKVRVINMSLAGPDNKILGVVINKIIDSGTAIVAAAGNEGPAAPPVYPAAYDKVIAVTAVDNQRRSYRWANRGDYIDFAAPGVGIYTARSSGDFGRESGTSMAAPIVSALFACKEVIQKNVTGQNKKVTQSVSAQTIMEQLIKQATDLGEAGRDPVFGYGLLEAH